MDYTRIYSLSLSDETSNKMNISRINIFLLLLLAAFSSAHAESRYMKLVDDADKAIAKENWAEAIKLLTAALHDEPDNPSNVMLLSNLGMIQFYAGADSMAIASLTDAHLMAPESITILTNRARVLASTGHLQAAIDDYNEICRLDSTLSVPYLHRGLIYLSTGNLSEATIQLERLRELAPDDIDTATALSALYSATGRPDEAIPYYTKIIETEPSAADYAGRAMCHLMLEHLPDAADDIASGLELDSGYAELYLCRALLNKMRYRPDDALADGQKAISLGADRTRVKSLLNL